jgi:Alkylmercury lyase
MTAPSDDTSRLTVGTTADRIRLVSPAARAVHRAVLHAFATTGAPPGRAAITRAASNADPGGLLVELHEQDVIRLDPAGAIWAAYPFSARPTPHLVDIDGGPTVYAMCAIDALGMSAMLDRPITIHSTEPDTGQPITVTVHHGRATWSPNTTVAVVGATRTNQECRPPDGRTPADIDPAATIGSAADIGCGVMNFFTDHANAARWLSAHPGVTGEVLAGKRALRLGIVLFGHLLDP